MFNELHEGADSPVEENRLLRVCPRCRTSFSAKRKTAYCKPCQSAYSRERYIELGLREKMRDKRFGLQPGEYNRMFEAQNGCCASCFTPFGDTRATTPCVDHDHRCCDWAATTKPICGNCTRGLLCWLCNVMLGNAKDVPIRLLAGAAYLEQWATARPMYLEVEAGR